MQDRPTWEMRVLIVVALILVVPASRAAAQPANCGDINNDGQITIADLSSLRAGIISGPCNATACYDLNASGGGFDPGDDVVLDRFLMGGGTIGEPGRSRGEQNLLFKLCTGAPPPIPCNTHETAANGMIDGNETWPGPAEGCNEFHIRGKVSVVDGATLTIRPGAVIRARADSDNPTLILVTRGSKLNANGVTNPIILTSDRNPGARAASPLGDWAGVVINGFAPENVTGAAYAEGDVTLGQFGGDNPNALTAVLRYVRIEFVGRCYREGCDTGASSALSLNSLGRLSIIDHVQVNQTYRDGFKWSGGTVRGKFLVATGVGDDDFDWEFGYQGLPGLATPPQPAVQFVLGVKDRDSTGGDPDAHGIEGDNSSLGFGLQPRSAPYFCNATLIGPRDTGGAVANAGDGARFRHGTAGRLENAVVEKWLSNGVDYRDGSPADIAPTVSIFDSGTACTGNATECADATAAGASLLNGPFTYPGRVSSYCNAAGHMLDSRYLLAAPTPATNDCAAASTFFDSAPYPGAFNTTTNWLTSDKPCCPAGNPFAIISGQRCWISFDIS